MHARFTSTLSLVNSYISDVKGQQLSKKGEDKSMKEFPGDS